MPRFLEDYFDKEKISSLLRRKGLSTAASNRVAQYYAEIATKLESSGHERNAAAKGVWVPGRIEVLGKHTDYAGGASLLMALARGFTVIAIPGKQQEVSVLDVASGEQVMLDAQGTAGEDAPAWAVYPQTTMQRLVKNFGRIGRGGIIAFKSDLPLAAGMSSSSVFIIATYLALQSLAHFNETDRFRSAIVGQAQLADYMGHVENGQSYKNLDGDRGVGTFGGSQDHAAILCARARHIMHVTFAPTEIKGYTPLPEDVVFCVASSGVKAEKTEGAKMLYNQAASRAREVTEIWNKAHVARLRSLAEIIQAPSFHKEAFVAQLQVRRDLAERFIQFYNETTIYIPQAIRALERRDFVAFGKLVAASQDDAEKKLKNQIPETIFLAQLARESGAYAASAFGAGFGGAVWALVPGNRVDGFLENWSRSYTKKFPSHKDATFFRDETGPAAFVL